MYVFGIILKLYLAPIFLTKDPRVWNRLYRIYSWLNDYNFCRKSPIFSLPRAQSLHRLSAVPQLYLCSLSAVSQQSLCSLSAVSQQSLCSLSAVSRSSNSWTKVRWGLSRSKSNVSSCSTLTSSSLTFLTDLISHLDVRKYNSKIRSQQRQQPSS